jgi:hypothetical protein
MTRLLLLSASVLAACAAAAGAAGPAPPEARQLLARGISFTTSPAGEATVVKAVSGGRLLGRQRLAGNWGFPRVATGRAATGLSADGKTLVLAQWTQGQLARPTRFALLAPRTLAVKRLLTIPGRFAFDALSPDASRLYLIEYVSVVGELRYRVRAYDVGTGRLQARVVADKRSGWTAMAGYPIARATSEDGAWSYTLYGNETRPFVHALDTVHGIAVCIDLPLEPAGAQRLRLRLAGARLSVVGGGEERAAIDTGTLRLVQH